MTITSPSLNRRLSTASKASSSRSKHSAGPLKRRLAMPATLTMAPCGARLPASTISPPVGESGAEGRAHHVLLRAHDDIAQILGHSLAGDGHAIAVQIAAVEQCLHKHRHAANVVQMIAFATRGC